MARRKRQYGTGCLRKTERGWVIRWRESEIAPDGTTKRVLRFQTLGAMPQREAAKILSRKIMAATDGATQNRACITFDTLVEEWMASVLPMYKPSTQKNHRHIVEKHLRPRFGTKVLSAISRQEVQAYVAHLQRVGYAPKTIDHIHDVLSALLRTGITWGHLRENPARGVSLPRLTTVRPKWAMTPPQATALLKALPPLPRTLVGLALLSGLRRGELFALQWADLDEQARVLSVRRAVYEGIVSTPKTAAGVRQVPLSDAALQMIAEWRRQARTTTPEALVFGTRSGKPLSPNNVSRQWVYPSCEALGLPHATWLTFRRTYSSWAHEQGVPGKVVAQLMGHTRVDTTLNVYTQVLDGSLRAAADTIGDALFTIVHSPKETSELTH